jgi:hypothetical protein
MKDPLDEALTAYEVLGVAEDVTSTGLLAAMKKPRADVDAGSQAYSALGDADQRTAIDLLLYDDATLARLLGAQDAARALGIGERARTADAWRRYLVDSFDRGALDFEAVHALGVLSYWSADRAFRDGAVDQASWERAFGCFALVSRRAEGLGPRFAGERATQVGDAIRNLLPQRLADLPVADGPVADGLRAARAKLETSWAGELAAATELDELTRARRETRLQGGPLFLRALGRLELVRAWLDAQPRTAALEALGRRFSANSRVGEIAELVSGGGAGAAAAIRAIEALPDAERGSTDVRALEVEARVRFGHDRLEGGDWEAGARELERATALAPGRPLPQHVLDKVKEVCLSEGHSAKGEDPARALAIWERGLKLYPRSSDLRIAIGDEITAASERTLAGAVNRLKRGLIDRAETTRIFRAELPRLSRANDLGSKRAQEIFSRAQETLKELEPASEAPRPVDVPPRPVAAPREVVVPPRGPAAVARPAVEPRRPAPIPQSPSARAGWPHRLGAAVAAAWFVVGAATLLALASGYDVELLGADLFSPLDAVWRRAAGRVGIVAFALAPVALWLLRRRLASRGGWRSAGEAPGAARWLGRAWLAVGGVLLVDQLTALFSDHFLPRALRAFVDPLGVYGLLGCFALGAAVALPLVIGWCARPRGWAP